jgi:uncharacterized protein
MNHTDSFLHRYGPFAIVTGASSSIGAEFARQLAARGLSLVLVARRQDLIETLAADLSRSHGVRAIAVPLDLNDADFLTKLEARTHGLDIGMLISNAFDPGQPGAYVDSNLETSLRMLNVNCQAPLVLAHAYGRRIAARGRGGIIFTSGPTSFFATPFSIQYAATKAYVRILAEGLGYELRSLGVDVLVLLPAFVDSDLVRAWSSQSSTRWMSVKSLVEETIAALGKKQRVIPGFANRIFVWTMQLLPDAFVVSLWGKINKAMVAKGSFQRERT